MSDPKTASSLLENNEMTAAYHRMLPAIQAVPDTELVAMNTDVYSAMTTVLGALPRIVSFRDQIARLSKDAADAVDDLRDYALAVGEADNRYAIASAPPARIVALNAEAISLRETIRVDATALVHHGLIDPKRLVNFDGKIGYKNVAQELGEWANLMSDAWPKIQGKTALTAELIQRAKEVSVELATAAGTREVVPQTASQAAHLRAQAFALLVHAYDQVQRALTYLRWSEDDAATIAPPLYKGRPRASRTSVHTAGTNGSDAAAPALSSAPSPAPSPTPTNGASQAGPGLPGGSPLAN